MLGEGRDSHQTKAGELAQGEAVTIGADDLAHETFTTMAQRKVRRLLAIDGHRLVGMVARADVARSLPAPPGR
ncbi:CBS domain-containing protein [Streptomyces bugieae]|uniref:CBS domain-containing protein n=1 Tax=Streptomyces bugieae TaxID=3098223 RepID=A0ABU7NWX3_9ACTN|nr:CBS domain-containing protein [Streptomyces sp. DSM 41528]